MTIPWKTIATYAVKLAIWASDHPDSVIQIVQELRPKPVEPVRKPTPPA
jgi:hypothetical protein